MPLEINRVVKETSNLIKIETLYVSIPAGIDDNEMIYKKGNVESNVYGDVKVLLKLKMNTFYKGRTRFNMC